MVAASSAVTVSDHPMAGVAQSATLDLAGLAEWAAERGASLQHVGFQVPLKQCDPVVITGH